MTNKKSFTTEEKKVMTEIRRSYTDGISVLIEDYRASNIKIKKSSRKTINDNIIDKFISGDCPDTIRRSLNLSRDEVDSVLLDYGAI